MNNPGILLLLFFIAIVALLVLLMIGRFISLWFQAYVSGTPISLFNIIGMSLRKIPPREIVTARIVAFKAGLKSISVADLETHYLAGGNIANVVQAMIAASKANIDLDWQRATAIDLAGRNILEAVQTSVNPKVIDCPNAQLQDFIVGVARDGIELKARARVTVRTNIAQLVGGATEETIIARVGEGIVSTVGEAETYKEVLRNPDEISKTVLKKGLDASTAFEILSIDIADINVGLNKGAELRESNAIADKVVRQAEAEGRRAMGVALEQENAAKLVEAQAEVPKALAEALRSGNLGAFDYYKLRNIEADTKMRDQIGKEGSHDEDHKG